MIKLIGRFEMSILFTILTVITFLSLPILVVILIIRAIMGKPLKKTAIGLLMCVGAFIEFSVLGTFTSPSTWCECEYGVIEETKPTCSERAGTYKYYTIYENNNIEYKGEQPRSQVTDDLNVHVSNKCEHEDVGKMFSFQPQNSTATSYVKSFCTNCDEKFGYKIFRGTPTDTSYLEPIKVHSDVSEIVGEEYYTITAIVTLADYEFNKTKIRCEVQSENVEVNFCAEFREEYEESVALLQEGDIVTFRGRFYDDGCGFTDCELIAK
jgi:hypothetical protein